MKVLVAPNALKGSLSAAAAASAMAAGVRRAAPKAEIVSLPVADGGDSLVEVLGATLGGERRVVQVCGPRGDAVEAHYLFVPAQSLAIIEMAQASGLVLLPEAMRDPTQTTSYGTGELMQAAADAGAQRIVLGIGGSATCDGGAGAAAALGVEFYSHHGRVPRPRGLDLPQIVRLDCRAVRERWAERALEIACDVTNPLLGPLGAAAVYGPQKGAGPAEVELLEAGLEAFAACLHRDTGVDATRLEGGGAAGGMGAGLHALLGGRLRRGIDLVLDLVDMAGHLADADLVLTAEGALDSQTAHGKAPAGVAQAAQAQGVPCVAVAGSLTGPFAALHALGLCAVHSLCNGPMALDAAMDQAEGLLTQTTEQVVRTFLAKGTRVQDAGTVQA